jgi:hypothetical protein
MKPSGHIDSPSAVALRLIDVGNAKRYAKHHKLG